MFKALVLTLALAINGYCVDTPVANSFRDFSGGLNNFNASVSLQANESPNLQNVVIDEPLGALSQRKGWIACGNLPSGNTATNLYEYSKNDGSRSLIATDNENIYQTADCTSWVTIKTGLNSQALPRFATIQDKLWIVNGSTYPITWDGTTATILDGLSNRPLGQKGKFITWWKGRVWIGNTPTSPSGLYFTDIVDNGVTLDPATSTMAWANALNLIYFNRDDGSPLYGIKIYRDNLYAFKETGISRLVFQDDFNLNVTKNVSVVGSKFNESIVEMDDGLLRFAGRDGVYAFDGSTVKRLSTRWAPTYESIKQPSLADKYNLWDSATDWLAGTLDVNMSTIPFPGSMSPGYEDFADLNHIKNPVWTIVSGPGVVTSTNGYMEVTSGGNATLTVPSVENSNWNIKYLRTNLGIFRYFFMQPNGYQVSIDINGKLTLRKNSTTDLCYFYPNIPISTWGNISVSRTSVGLFTVISGTNSCTATDTDYTTSSGQAITLSELGGVDDITGVLKSTGIYTSQISTATGITVWKTFEVDETLKGQTISYEMRTGTTPYNTNLATYKAISPGSVISTTTDTNYQWRANFSTTDNGVTPLLNSASANWITGGTSKSALYGLMYKSRYWLSASTTQTNDYNDLVMVESKSPIGTHTRYNLGLSAMTIWNNNLYAAISNSSTIARVDYGDNDGGSVINSFWDSRDDIYENPILYKSINRLIVDYSNVPANSGLQFGLSKDLGNSWSYKTVNTNNNPLLYRNTSVLNMDANRALQFRSRVYNNTLGIGFTLYGIHGFGTASDFVGNR